MWENKTSWIEIEIPPKKKLLERWNMYTYLNIYIYKYSMYGLFTYIWVVLGVNVGKYTIH